MAYDGHCELPRMMVSLLGTTPAGADHLLRNAVGKQGFRIAVGDQFLLRLSDVHAGQPVPRAIVGHQGKVHREQYAVNADGIPNEADERIGENAAGRDVNMAGVEVHGLTRIGYITGPKNNQDAEERFIGYRDTLVKHGIPIREEYIVQGDYSENVDRSVEQLLDHAPELEAIVSANDEMTVAIYRVCRARGLEVGKDIAVTGFDDMLMAGYMDPPLTTARQDYDTFSRQAVESALGILRGESVNSRRIHVPFIRRCSCGCAPEKGQERPEQEEVIRRLQRSREYQHNSWIGALMNREMLLEVDDPKRFFASIGSCMAYLGTAGSYLCLFEKPLRVKPGTIPDFPERIHVCMRQEGKHVEGYSWDEAPVMLRKSGNPAFRFPGNVMTFLLFDEEYQYGVLNVEIEPEKIDFYYMLSLDIGTSLRYMDIWTRQKQYRAQLQAMARTDELTGLYNRAGLISARERLTADRQRPVTVIMADLDHLKQINDHFRPSGGRYRAEKRREDSHPGVWHRASDRTHRRR